MMRYSIFFSLFGESVKIEAKYMYYVGINFRNVKLKCGIIEWLQGVLALLIRGGRKAKSHAIKYSHTHTHPFNHNLIAFRFRYIFSSRSTITMPPRKNERKRKNKIPFAIVGIRAMEKHQQH